MGITQQTETPKATSPTAAPASSTSNHTIPREAPPAFDAPPPMPPPPYFKTQFIKPSSFKTAINEKVDKPLVSLFRLGVRVLQLIFALASGISYAIELKHGNGRGEASGSFAFSQVAFGATLCVFAAVTTTDCPVQALFVPSAVARCNPTDGYLMITGAFSAISDWEV